MNKMNKIFLGVAIVLVTYANGIVSTKFPEVKCQNEDEREIRVEEIVNWFTTRDEDVILLQEVWSFHDELRNGVSDAGYCHYIMTEETIGSGLANFSKHPIDQQLNKDEGPSRWLHLQAYDMLCIYPKPSNLYLRQPLP